MPYPVLLIRPRIGILADSHSPRDLNHSLLPGSKPGRPLDSVFDFHELHVVQNSGSTDDIAICNYKALLRSCAVRVSALNMGPIRLSSSYGRETEQAKLAGFCPAAWGILAMRCECLELRDRHPTEELPLGEPNRRLFTSP